MTPSQTAPSSPDTISVQKSLNGKLKDPPWRGAYCSLKTPRALAEATLRAKVGAKQKAEQEHALKEAHPREGVYRYGLEQVRHPAHACSTPRHRPDRCYLHADGFRP